tara:strand:+ start:233 stop:445 length:213 start_codon:yes stop_codon:yes gene_type:complete
MLRREPLDDLDDELDLDLDLNGNDDDVEALDIFLLDLDEYDDTDLINESGVTAAGYESLGTAWEREEFAS